MEQLDLSWSGKIEPLLRDESISVIMVNDLNKIFVEKDDKLVLSNVSIHSEEELIDFVKNLLTFHNRIFEENIHIYNFSGIDGSRVHIILPPLSSKTTITIQKLWKPQRLKKDDLIIKETMTELESSYLNDLIKNNKNVIVSGGTGSGKTTLLNMLIDFVSENNKMVVFENTRELEIDKTHFIRYELFSLTKEDAYRSIDFIFAMPTPNTLVFGEVRDGTSYNIINGLATTSKNGLLSIHSNTPEQALERMWQTATTNDFMQDSEQEFKKKLGSSIDHIVQITRLANGQRMVIKIVDVIDYDEQSNHFRLKTAFTKS